MREQKQNIERLIKLTEEKRLNKTEINDAVKISISLLNQESPPITEVIDLIANMHYSVIAPFAEGVLEKIPIKTQYAVLESFLTSDKIKQNANRYGFRRTLIWIEIFFRKKANFALISGLLLNASEQYKEKGSDGKLDSFLATKLDQLNSLDYSGWQEEELKNFFCWILEICNRNDDEGLKSECLEFVQSKTNGEVAVSNTATKDAAHETDFKVDEGLAGGAKDSNKTRVEVKEKKTPMQLVDNGKHMLKELDRILTQLQNRKDFYRTSYNEQKNDAEKLASEKDDLEKQLEYLGKENKRLKEEISQLTSDNELLVKEKKDLYAQLEIVIKAENNQAKFEVGGLKNEIYETLNRDYKDFQELKNLERDEEDVEIFIDMLQAVFGKLRKKGIEF